jgi:hypothetical protein
VFLSGVETDLGIFEPSAFGIKGKGVTRFVQITLNDGDQSTDKVQKISGIIYDMHRSKHKNKNSIREGEK